MGQIATTLRCRCSVEEAFAPTVLVGRQDSVAGQAARVLANLTIMLAKTPHGTLKEVLFGLMMMLVVAADATAGAGTCAGTKTALLLVLASKFAVFSNVSEVVEIIDMDYRCCHCVRTTTTFNHLICLLALSV